MSHRRAVSSQPTLEGAAARFRRWRARTPRGTRIPEDLWEEASRLAAEHGVSRVSGVLKLDYYSLKRRLESSTSPSEVVAGKASECAPAFVEVPLFSPDPVGSCVVEVETASGRRLRVELKGKAVGELESVVRALLKVAR